MSDNRTSEAMVAGSDSTEWYWCSECEEANEDDCGFYWNDDDGQPECPNCGSQDVQV